ncbi:nucleotidyltransferase domain-containing protein [Streptomyces hydrogenans]|uniref:Polymerase nucleotidyl transferase domain-containing protein n=1 Tax=Streptomyces hydrogenans TaxID=1873719 RepID=A0ABQ3PKV6_9ACTN|nr:nucleotidyltransferase domain-containing protein [Streptomyces hydrogenans]GHG20421.1 hypothetical protein GCM10018784_37140 [Streptomyces hydrogenans]GHI23122.1 hypothetical protein Shyd_44930 [Streptomyces hydrogenans]GHI25648.1 hypothetical protein Shyd_70190 [Streptomyces hydrogenans]GHI25664.1 hypothetical protein Shyd_70350 [Streptomyces hydrogenans]
MPYAPRTGDQEVILRVVATARQYGNSRLNARIAMSTSPGKNFEILLDRITLSPLEMEAALNHARAVCGILKSCPLVSECVISGSIARSTAVRKFSDVDIIAILKDSKRVDFPSSLAIKDISDFLSLRYKDIQVFDSAIRIDFPGIPGVDVVPAVHQEMSSSGYPLLKIPARRQSWIDYIPEEQSQTTEGSAKRLGAEFKQAIRLAKWWSYENSTSIPSYEIEELASRAFRAWPEMRSLPEALAVLLEEVATAFEMRDSDRNRDSARKAARIARTALVLSTQGDIRESVNLWRCLLGEQFPVVVF